MAPTTSSKVQRTSKPYERPSKSKGKAGEQLSTSLSTSTGVNMGGPSTAQKSRKGKKAWRKNVDVSAEEVALEQAREEERASG